MNTSFWSWVLFSFNGRISRMYYWLVVLLFLIVQFVYTGVFFGANAGAIMSGDVTAMSPLAAICALPIAILFIWIGLAVAVKRWHDRGKSGWWVLIGLIPIVGPIWVLVECGFLPGTQGVNQYGMVNTPPGDPFTASGSVPERQSVPPAPQAPSTSTQPSSPPPQGNDDNPYAP